MVLVRFVHFASVDPDETDPILVHADQHVVGVLADAERREMFDSGDGPFI
jgi:hypothetical protein